HDWREAMLWLLLCVFIDGVDGTFARWWRVKEVLPQVDGKTIDYVIDFATYAIIPAYFFYQAEMVSEAWRLPCTFIILLVSAIYYGIDGMVSDDLYFVGFPVMWNVAILFLFFVFQFPPAGNVAYILLLAILHFVPVKFPYPSRTPDFRIPTIIATVLLIGALMGVLWVYPAREAWLTGLSTAGVVYFTVVSIWATFFKK
ncbi:MAG: phosphatidylcholine/phosphatidylserine synthase, partial [Bacteroidota bacterium]